MRFSSPIRTGLLTALALSLSIACSGSTDGQTQKRDEVNRVGTKIDKNGNTIFNGTAGQKETPKANRSPRSNTPSDDVAAGDNLDIGDTDITDDGTDVAAGELGEDTDNGAAPDPVVNLEAEAERLNAEKAAQEAEQKRLAEAAEEEKRATSTRLAAEKNRKAEKDRIAKAQRKTTAKLKRDKLARRKAKVQKAKPVQGEDQLKADAAKEKARLDADAALTEQRLASAKAAKAAVAANRRAQAEAAALQEKARQKEEMARVGQGLNDECPYSTLEDTAAKGELTTGDINCLESSIDKAVMDIDRANVSMVLLTNSRAAGDIEDWEARMENHLINIERDNPALAYRYALHLFEKGPGESLATFRWTGIALQSRSAWAGEAYTDRVYAIYKLRAAASQSLWKQSIEALEAFPGENNENRVKTQRILTRNVAKEWYGFATTHEQNSNTALQLCNIASLDTTFCESAETSDAN